MGYLRKPRYWALALLARLGRSRLPVAVSGDGAGGLVEALAARHDDGRIGIAVWNVTLDQGKIGGDPVLDRLVRLRVSVPPGLLTRSGITASTRRIPISSRPGSR